MTDLDVLKLFINKNTHELERVICAPQPQIEAFLLAAWAVKDDEVDILKMALQYCDPMQNNSMLLRQSVEFGSKKCFKVLFSISNPLENKSEALQWAIFYDRSDMFNQLVPVSNIADALSDIDEGFDGVVFRQAQNILNARNQSIRIEEGLPTTTHTVKSKKI